MSSTVQFARQAMGAPLFSAWTKLDARTCLTVLLGVYVIVYASLLYAGDFKPYVLDNNESYSTLNHARNLIERGPAKSFGLADDAASPSAEAHPFVHTHQGNVPRLFAAVLHLLGLRSIESQITVTTFTAGLAVVFMAFRFFTACAGHRFALLACLVLITDYLYFAQWQANTYRIWTHFFIFSSLLTAELYAQSKNWRWLPPIFVNCLFLFYYEFAFVSFTATMTGLYLAWRLRRDWRRLLLGWGAMGLGAVASLVVLLFQVVGYLGWEDALTDARFTFFARNFAAGGAPAQALIEAFYGDRNIAFFYNIASNRTDGVLEHFWPSFVRWHLQTLTPFVTLMTMVALLGFAIRNATAMAVRRWQERDSIGRYRPVISVAAAALSGLLVFQVLWLSDLWSARATLGGLDWQAVAAVCAAMGVLIGVAGFRVLERSLTTGPNASAATIHMTGCTLFLLALLWWGVIESGLYDPTQQILWLEMLAPPGRFVLQGAAIVAAIALWCVAILVPPHPQRGDRGWGRLYGFFASGAIAVAVMGGLFPGYVWSGYLDRDQTVLVAHVAAAVALAIYVTLAAAGELSERAGIIGQIAGQSGLARRMRVALRPAGGFGVFAAAAMGLHWIWAQGACALLLPPNQFAWIDALAQQPLEGSTIVSNTYAVPFAVKSGSWGYTDWGFAAGGYEQTASGFEPIFSGHVVWLADAKTNPSYRRPDLFVCFLNPTPVRAIRQLQGHPLPGCRNLGLVKEARSDEWRPFRHKLLAIDKEESDSWAIIKLDWTAPPFLRDLTPRAPGRHVETQVSPANNGNRAVQIRYDYAQQDGESEKASVVRVYRVDTRGELCGSRPPDRNDMERVEPVIEVSGVRRLTLPRTLTGRIVVSVRPVSARRAGREYFSDVINLGGSNGGC